MASAGASDRLAELKAFDDTKTGVKGLVDAGVTAVPRIFHHPPDPHRHAAAADGIIIPVIDLQQLAASRAQLVARVKAAAETTGFFQVVNHGVPEAAMSEMLAAVRRFNESPAEERRPYYTRDAAARRVRYSSNYDLFQAPAASWRDTLFLEMAPNAPPPEEVPPACRDVVFEYTRQVQSLCSVLLGLLSEALGLRREYLEHDAGCRDGLSVAAHYYPPCPEPHLTLGAAKHSDATFLTVLLQDGVGALQALLGNGGWVDVPPGALVVNIGDFLEIMSNGRLKSVEHRVVATAAARVSVACFFRPYGPSASTRVYGPIVDAETPRYRSFTAVEFLRSRLDGQPPLDRFRL